MGPYRLHTGAGFSSAGDPSLVSDGPRLQPVANHATATSATRRPLYLRSASHPSTAEPVITGTSTRWYVSSVELGQGIAETNLLKLSTKPQFLVRVQPYSVCLQRHMRLAHAAADAAAAFVGVGPEPVCRDRPAPFARGVRRPGFGGGDPAGPRPVVLVLRRGELDVWEVWRGWPSSWAPTPTAPWSPATRWAATGPTSSRCPIRRCSPRRWCWPARPTCGVRLLPGTDIPADPDPGSHCAREGDTWPLLVNARWLPFVIAHGLLDELVPFASVAEQVLELDRLGYRYRFTVYPAEDHVVFLFQDKFDDPVSHMGTGPRQPDPGHITFAWYPQLVRPDLGIGPHRLWWLSELAAAPDIRARRGAVAEVDARSYARPDQARTTRRRRGFVPHLDPTPGLYTEQYWQLGPPADALPYLTLTLTGVAALTVDIARAGLAPLPRSTIAVATDSPAQITLAALPPATKVELDGTLTGAKVAVPAGRHRISLARS